MTRRPLVAAAVVAICFAVPALAQSPGSRITIESSAPQKQEGLVRVQTSINFTLPGPTGEGEEAIKLRERARRIVYEMAGRECDLAREVLAKDCRLESVNSNITVNRPYNNSGQEGFNVQGSMSLQITLK